MKALVVTDFKKAPSWTDYAEPRAEAGEVLIEVTASALTNLVKGQANGTHYSKQGPLPFVPGGEGIGRLADGTRVFFLAPRKPFGAMADRTVVKRDFYVPLPADIDNVTAAAVANPAMSSWAALTKRAQLVKGESVLINGATGVAGQMAIQIAKHLGAKRVIATGRDPEVLKTLGSLGADTVIALGDGLAERLQPSLAEVSVVLDYLWGPSAETILTAIGTAHVEHAVRYVQIGSIAGASIALPAFPLRSTGLQIMGSGLGSVSDRDLLHVIGEALTVATKIGLKVESLAVPMSQGEKTWIDQGVGERIVFTNGPV